MPNDRSFLLALKVQLRVISALFLREIITRYGRNNVGFLWLFLEPALATVTILLLWKIIRADMMYGLPVIDFMMTGYPLAMMWRNSANRCIGAIAANQGLRFHRNVRLLDIFISRALLEIASTTSSFVIIYLFLFSINMMSFPSNVLLMICAWLLMAIFSIGLGFTIGILSEQYEVFRHIWRPVSFVLFPLSGIFFLVDFLPQKIQDIIIYIPMINGTEMFRHGYFGTYIKSHDDLGLLIFSNIIILFLGLSLIQKYSKE